MTAAKKEEVQEEFVRMIDGATREGFNPACMPDVAQFEEESSDGWCLRLSDYYTVQFEPTRVVLRHDGEPY